MMMVALGSFGISISLPTGPVMVTSLPGFKSPEKRENLNQDALHTHNIMTKATIAWRANNINYTVSGRSVSLHKKFEHTPLTVSPASLVYTSLFTQRETWMEAITPKTQL